MQGLPMFCPLSRQRVPNPLQTAPRNPCRRRLPSRTAPLFCLVTATFAGLLLAACANSEASHLPHPLMLPAEALATTAGNALYGARRGRVEAFVKANHPALMAEIGTGGGPLLEKAMDLAAVRPDMRPALRLRLQADQPLHAESPEALVIALMVHGGN